MDHATTRSTRAVLARMVLVAALCAIVLPLTGRPAGASPLSTTLVVSATGTGIEDWSPGDYLTPTPDGIFQPGDDLSTAPPPTDTWIRTQDALEYQVSFSANATPGAPATNVVAVITLSSPHAFWDMRGVDYQSGANPPCPGGASASGQTLTCNAGTITNSTARSFSPIARVAPSAGHGKPIDATVVVTDAGGGFATSTSPQVQTSAVARYDLQKGGGNRVQTLTSFTYSSLYSLKIVDPDPLGSSALASVQFNDHLAANSFHDGCSDTQAQTVPVVTNPDTQVRELSLPPPGFPNDPPATCAPQTAFRTGAGETVAINWPDVDWTRPYPPPTFNSNPGSNASSGWLVAMHGYTYGIDKDVVDLSDNVLDGIGTATSGNSIGLASFPNGGPLVSDWHPVDVDGNPNLPLDPSNPGLGGQDEPLPNNVVTHTVSLSQGVGGGKLPQAMAPVVDGQHVMSQLLVSDTGGVAYQQPVHLCDKFDNAKMSVVETTAGSGTAVINTTANQFGGFPAVDIDYGRSALFGQGVSPNPSSDGWHDQATTGCDATDTIDGFFFDESQVDWANASTPGMINARDVNMVRYRPQAGYVNPSLFTASYRIQITFEVLDNTPGDYLLDWASMDIDGPGPSAWLLGSCFPDTAAGACGTPAPNPPELRGTSLSLINQGELGQGFIHVDSHPTIRKDVVGSATGIAPHTFTYEIDLGNTTVAGNTDPRGAFTVRDELPPLLEYAPGSSTVVSNVAGLGVSGPVVTGVPATGQTLEWTITGLTLDVTSADMPVIHYDVNANAFAPSGSYDNRAEIDIDAAPGTAIPWNPANNWSLDEWWISANSNGTSTWDVWDEARVDVTGVGSVLIEKTAAPAVGSPGDPFTYSLTYGNGGGTVESMSGFDIFPWDGDPRGTQSTGVLELTSVTEDPGSDVDIWVSYQSPAVLDALDAGGGIGGPTPGGINPTAPGLPGTGSATWPCRVQDIPGVGCPSLSGVTGIWIIGADPNPSGTGIGDSFLPAGFGPYSIDLDFVTVGASGGDHFENDWGAVFPPIGAPVNTASTTSYTLFAASVGDFVFADVNGNGVFDGGTDTPIGGVQVDVYEDGSSTLVGSAVTDPQGRWVVPGLAAGDYYAEIPAAAFGSGQVLEGFTPSINPSADPDDDFNEDVDHDARPASGAVRSGVFTLAPGTEPLGDDVASLGGSVPDGDTNFTIDFGLVPSAEVRIDKQVQDPQTQQFGETAVVVAGSTVTWQITVTNTGASAVTNVTVSDVAASDCARSGTFTDGPNDDGRLDPGESDTYTCTSANVTVGLTNVATVEGLDPIGGVVVDDDDASVSVVVPSVDIVKTPDIQVVRAGSQVTFSIAVTNTGPVPLTSVQVTDPLTPACDLDVTAALGGPLQPGQTYNYGCTLAAASASFVNVAQVTAAASTGSPVTDADPATVTVIDPSIDIVKTALTPVVVAGDDATFELTVINTGDVDLVNVTVSDPLAPGCDRVLGSLAVGGTATYQCQAIAVGNGFTNVAVVSALATDGLPVSDSDDAAVDVIDPAIAISKTAVQPTIVAGDTVTFEITVSNIGTSDLTGVVVADPLTPDCDRVLGTLVAGAAVTFTCEQTNVTSSFTNVASATGTGPLSNTYTASDDAEVTVIRPSVAITKTATNPVIVSGGAATFEITVRNTGDVDLANVEVTDPVAPDCDHAIGLLAAGDSSTYTCTLLGATATFTNVAQTSGDDPLGNPVTATDDAVVTVIRPAVDIEKSSIEAVVTSGDDATFEITVTNVGDVDLTGVVVDDLLTADCAAGGTQTDGPDDDGVLAPGESDVFRCTAPAVTEGFTNVAQVRGLDPLGGTWQDADDADVDVIRPALAITKTALTPSVVVGETATFEIAVTNVGDVPLTDVAVTDPLGPGCDAFIGDLAVGETVTYTCEVTDVRATFTNVADVTGLDPMGASVFATDAASVEAHPVTVPPRTEFASPTTTRTGSLPITGSQVLGVLSGGLVLVGVGALLTLWARRRSMGS